MTRLASSIALGAGLGILAGAAVAAEGDYLKRYEGEFVGAGTVRPEIGPSSVEVECTLSGKATDTTVEVSGKCGALLISREIGVSLTTDGDSYAGQYLGSRSGPSALEGQREGDALTLAVSWPRVVFDDREATMTLVNDGSGAFVFRILDTEDGKPVISTDITFRRK